MANHKLNKNHRYKDQQQVDKIKKAVEICNQTSKTGGKHSFSSFVVAAAGSAAAEIIKQHKKQN